MLQCGRDCAPTRIIREIERADTSSRPILVLTDEGPGYVKAANNPMGWQSVVAELICAELASWLGLTVPPFAVIRSTDIKLIMSNGVPVAGPLFFSKQIENAIPHDGSDVLITKLRNPGDVARLIVFDTWVRNFDRYCGENEYGYGQNPDNVLFSKSNRQKKYSIFLIDHGSSFCEEEMTAEMLGDGAIRDGRVFGFFPEFSCAVSQDLVEMALKKLSSLERHFVVDVVNSVPPEWGVGRGCGDALIRFICDRAKHVVDTLAEKIVDSPRLPGVDGGE